MACVTSCPEGAITPSQNDGPVIDRSRCIRCGTCVEQCRGNALQLVGEEKTAGEVVEEIQKDVAFFRHSSGGVTLSGGEVLMQPEFAKAILQACRRLGIHTAIETSGQANYETLREIAGLADFVYFDLKHPDPEMHKAAVGCSNATIVKNVQKLTEEFAHIHLRVPVIPGVNDSVEHISALASFIATLSVPSVELLPYHRLGEGKYKSLGLPNLMEGVETHTKEELLQLVAVMKEYINDTEVLCNID